MQDCSEGSSVEKIVLFGDYDVIPGLMFKDLVKEQASVENFELADVSGNDTLAVMCSSGTTGLPKGVMLTHINFLTLSQHMKYYVDTSTESNNIEIKNFLALIPWFHAYGFITTFGVLSFHLEIVFLTRFEDKLFLETIQNYKVNMMTLVPPLAVFLAKHPLVLKYNLKCVNEVWCGAAPLSAEIQNAVSQRLGINFIRQGYGLTEVTMACCVDLSTKRRLGSCGTPAPGMKIKVIDIETGKRKGVGEEGELWIKSPLRMKGYMGDPAASEALLDQEGYVRTGDIGHYDNEGAFYIVDRLKELIKYNGFQVAPAELEALLLQHPGVAEAGVVGAPHESAGELPTAFVVRQPGAAAVTERELQDHVASKDAQILGINGACRGIELTNTTINRDIVTFTMRDTKTKTAKSFVIRDEIMNIFKNNRNNIILATNTIITAKSHEGVHHFSSASHQQHQPLYTDPQPGSRDPPVYIEHCSPDKIKIDSQTKSSSTRSLPFAHYLYYITIILSLSTTTVHCSQIGDWQQSALGGSNSQPLLPSQREGRASEQSTSDTASSQPESISNIQQTNIRGAGGLRTVTISNSPNMTNVNFPNGPDRTVTISNSPNMSNVKLQYNDEPGGTITVTITNCPNMSNVRFIVNAGAGSAITATLTNCADMSDVAFVFNTPGGITTATISNCPDMSNVQFIFNGGPGGTITVTISNRPNMSNGIYYYVNGIYT
ncbi:uncharacterized protein LOC134748293 isoform X3 [Cydia strobilella]